MTWLILVVAVATMILNVVVLLKMLLTQADIQEAARIVAANLAVAQTAVEGVAGDLADQHGRADAAQGPHGASADAAARSGDT